MMCNHSGSAVCGRCADSKGKEKALGVSNHNVFDIASPRNFDDDQISKMQKELSHQIHRLSRGQQSADGAAMEPDHDDESEESEGSSLDLGTASDPNDEDSTKKLRRNSNLFRHRSKRKWDS